jgi:hypothetical protein
MIRFLALMVAMVMLSAPVCAQQPDAAPEAAPAKPARPKTVCRSIQEAGTRIARSKCYTAEQWAEYDRVQAEAASKLASDVSRNGSKVGDSGSSIGTGALFGLGPH